jgi:hypothetical protein
MNKQLEKMKKMLTQAEPNTNERGNKNKIHS